MKGHSKDGDFRILPYSAIVGQDDLKLALELAYVAPRIGGVLISGERGTAKSTAARAFSQMMHGSLPTTLPINATEDRVVGGWRIDSLMKGLAKPQPGLLEEANGRVLYIDEVNLLDDHIVNIILDVTSTGVLVIARDGLGPPPRPLSFTLVGTMNPSEGELRPQLLDRFGLKVEVSTASSIEQRRQILQTVIEFDGLSIEGAGDALHGARGRDLVRRDRLNVARELLRKVNVSSELLDVCAELADKLKVDGHRGERVTALAACACSALRAAESGTAEIRVEANDVRRVVRTAMGHRRADRWTKEDDVLVAEVFQGRLGGLAG